MASMELDRVYPDTVGAPFCPHFPPCPGCPFIPIPYAAQLKEKRALVAAALERHLSPAWVQETTPSPRLHGYRNQSRLVFARLRTGRVELGLYAARTHRVIPIPRCPIHPEGLNAIARNTGRLVREARLPVYDERRKSGLLRYLAVRTDHARRHYLVGLVATESEDPRLAALAHRLRSRHPEIVGVTLHVHSSPDNVIFGGNDAWTIGSTRLEDRIGDAELRVSVRSFLQANHDAASWISRRIAARLAEARGLILDLYSGVGAIAFHMVGRGRKVIAVEEAPHAVADARAAAAGRISAPLGLLCESAERFLADPAQHVPGFAEAPLAAVVVNPPRAGCSTGVLEALRTLAPPVIAYVSCNPATLARDLDVLAPGYAIEEVTPVDMMPLTPHVEVLAFLARRR